MPDPTGTDRSAPQTSSSSVTMVRIVEFNVEELNLNATRSCK
jgi:hypothetical protein